jgi:ATP-dependent Clp protease adaptor protein ClpS
MSQSVSETEGKVRSEKKVKKPSMYRVLLHNDNYTTMEFVVEILVHIFCKTVEEATRIMLNVHEKGIGVCGVYTFEVAETKVDTVHSIARDHGFPLKCSMEKDD